MAPEQARGKTVDKRADISPFGVVLYQMLTGKRLFEGEDLRETLASVVKEPNFTPVHAKRENCSITACKKLSKASPRCRRLGATTHRYSYHRWCHGRRSAQARVASIGHRCCHRPRPIALSFRHFREPQPPSPHLVRFTIPLPQKTIPTAINGLTLSPDGRMLAFAGSGSDAVNRLYVRALDSFEARPLSGTEGIDASSTNSMTLPRRRIALI